MWSPLLFGGCRVVNLFSMHVLVRNVISFEPLLQVSVIAYASPVVLVASGLIKKVSAGCRASCAESILGLFPLLEAICQGVDRLECRKLPYRLLHRSRAQIGVGALQNCYPW